MLIPRNYKELFRQPTTSEVISQVRSWLDTRDIQPREALALLGSIHADLRQAKGQDGSVYAQYAQTVALLNHHMPDVHDHVVNNWRPPQINSPVTARVYDDSLFDDTAMMGVPLNKNVYEPDKETAKAEGEMLEVAGGEDESAEVEEGGEGDEGLDEEDEPEGVEESESKEENELEAEIETEEEESESEEIVERNEEEAGEDKSETEESELDEVEREQEEPEHEEVEELETEELEYEDVVEETFTESEAGMEDDVMATEAAEAAEHMSGVEYEVEPMEEDESPWAGEE